MQDLPPCPKCNDAYTYHDGTQFVCSSCLYEWNGNEISNEELIVKDCHNNLLQNGDSVILIKDLKVKAHLWCLKKALKSKISSLSIAITMWIVKWKGRAYL